MSYDTLEQMLADVAATIRPPERLRVSEAAAKYRYLKNEGSYVGPWMNEQVPYMIDPMDDLTSFDYEAVIFVGPAQCAKTDALILNWILYSAKCDPADFMLVQTSQSTAKDFSFRRRDRMFRHSEVFADLIATGARNRNVYDTKFSSGMYLTLSWPTINELSGKPIPRMALTDYDRMDQNVDGEGAPFDLSKKRTTSFGRFGMTLAESSPGFAIDTANYVLSSPHEAPPTPGILALYNRGNRQRFYWRCPHCHEPFRPEFDMLVYPETNDFLDAAEQAVMACPHCGGIIHHDGDEKNGIPGKEALNNVGKWVKEGGLWLPDGSIGGTPSRSNISSYWLKGVCARFTTWKNLVLTFLQASREYELTGSEEALKTTVNVDQGDPYLLKSMISERTPEGIMKRAYDFGKKVVPEGVRFLIATVDVQKNRFCVCVIGIGERGEMWIIDRYDIKKSERVDPDTKEHFWVAPHTHVEDWRLLIKEVFAKTYPLNDDSGRVMEIMHTFSDSGGREGVTANSYEFWRYLRDEPDLELFAYHRRFTLLKGSKNPNAPRVYKTFPDSDRKDRRAAARGEVPVLMVNSNMIKDMVANLIDREDKPTLDARFKIGAGVNFPNWLGVTYFNELTVEVRTPKGWENPKKLRNEAWDLLCYAVAGTIAPPLALEQLDWDEPPKWASPWDTNPHVREPEADSAFKLVKKGGKSLRRLATELA